jgi:hypothetical protein
VIEVTSDDEVVGGEIGLRELSPKESFVVGGTYMLIMVRDPLFGDWSVKNCALPSITMSCSLMRGVVALSTRIVVSALVLCEVPIGIPSFQKEDPCQYSIPLAMC